MSPTQALSIELDELRGRVLVRWGPRGVSVGCFTAILAFTEPFCGPGAVLVDGVVRSGVAICRKGEGGAWLAELRGGGAE